MSDARVKSDAACDFGYICADLLAKSGDFVDKTDFQREERIRGVFEHLRAARVCRHHRWEMIRFWARERARRIERLFKQRLIQAT